MDNNKKIVFSGIQPSGLITIGNYLGAIKNWVDIQSFNNSLFCIVDLHAITTHQDPKALTNNIINTIAIYIAAGLDPKKAIIFQQSSVPEHLELSWILANNTSVGWLNRMTQFKDKAGKDRELASLGLYSYPVLMAADILLYNADLVPVGDDQLQHIELCRDIAAAFNRRYKINHFNMPNALIDQKTKRIMNLRDARKKMSKSDPSDFTRINIFDSNELIEQKIKKATTDSIDGIYFDEEMRPEISNLLNIYSACSDKSLEEAAGDLSNSSTSQFKSILSEVIINKISPIRNNALDMINERSMLIDILAHGKKRAKEIATYNINKIYKIVGLAL